MNNVRLIDANKLKYKNLAEVNGRLTHVLTAEEIAAAPTVEPPEQLVLRARDNAELDHLKEAWNKGTINFTPIVAWAERPKGEWKRHDEWVNGEYVGGFYHVNCPCEDGYFVKWRMNYCGNCGALMQLDD